MRVFADGYRKHVYRRRNQNLTICTLNLRGVLCVNDPEPFKKLLFEGLGYAKAMGCGLFLIRSAS